MQETDGLLEADRLAEQSPKRHADRVEMVDRLAGGVDEKQLVVDQILDDPRVSPEMLFRRLVIGRAGRDGRRRRARAFGETAKPAWPSASALSPRFDCRAERIAGGLSKRSTRAPRTAHSPESSVAMQPGTGAYPNADVRSELSGAYSERFRSEYAPARAPFDRNNWGPPPLRRKPAWRLNAVHL